jgi:hypothetical protein
MARQPTTRLYVSGYRFLLRRMEHALVRGDVRMLDDPLRAQSLSLIAGVVLAVIGVAGCAVLAFFRPSGTLGSAPIIMARETGALYVRVGDTVHPVLNLASARLIAGTPANPEAVSVAAVDNAQRPAAGHSRWPPQRFLCRSATPNRAERSATMRPVPLSSPATCLVTGLRRAAFLSRPARRAWPVHICCTTAGAPRWTCAIAPS